MRDRDELKRLGRETEYSSEYAPEVLESFENRHPGNDYFVKLNCPEFTTLCPITKSLQLYLFSFRNNGDFHEDVVNIIMKDLIKLMDPKYIEVWGKFMPRGGISIDPYVNYGKKGTVWEEMAAKRLAEHDMYPEKIDNR